MTGYEIDYVVFCTNASGEPDIFETTLDITEEDCAEDIASVRATDEGYDGPFYAFERGALMERLNNETES